ncbi:MAG TPA: hypothetical protein VK452_08330 [Dissulfurispiraceae bacterium]|nr:hypothetical protein [Dissulfurispiraceae bacterium]
MSDNIKTIALVEREHGTIKKCSHAIESKFGDKIELVHFGTAKDALAFMASHGVDLVISSLLQSQIDGIELLNSSKEINPNVPFIIYTNLQYKEEFFAWGFKPDAYVVRREDMSELIIAVEGLLKIRQQ